MTPARAARLRLGNPVRLREESLDAIGFPRLEALARDVSLAARRLRRSAGFTVATTLTLALAIGANAALFALIDAVLLRPLPYPEAERLVALWEATAFSPRSAVAPANLADYRVPAFESLAAWHDVEMDVSGEGQPEALGGHAVTADFFSVLGVGPSLGRPFPIRARTPPWPAAGDRRPGRPAFVPRESTPSPRCGGSDIQRREDTWANGSAFHPGGHPAPPGPPVTGP
jgi:hypothetical protein